MTGGAFTILDSVLSGNAGGGVAGPHLTGDGGFIPFTGTLGFHGQSITGEDDRAFGSDRIAPDKVTRAGAGDTFVTVVAVNCGAVNPGVFEPRLSDDRVPLDAARTC